MKLGGQGKMYDNSNLDLVRNLKHIEVKDAKQSSQSLLKNSTSIDELLVISEEGISIEEGCFKQILKKKVQSDVKSTLTSSTCNLNESVYVDLCDSIGEILKNPSQKCGKIFMTEHTPKRKRSVSFRVIKTERHKDSDNINQSLVLEEIKTADLSPFIEISAEKEKKLEMTNLDRLILGSDSAEEKKADIKSEQTHLNILLSIISILSKVLLNIILLKSSF